MSFARVAVDICQLVLNQWATAPPHKAPQQGRFKTKGETVFGLAPVIFWVSGAWACRVLFVADITPSAPEAIAVPYLRTGIFDYRSLSRSPTRTKPTRARFISLLSFFLAYRQRSLPLRHTYCFVWYPSHGLWYLHPSTMLRSPRLPLHLRPLHQTRTPAGHLGTVQLRPTPRISRLAVSHGRTDVRGPNAWKLDHRMRDWVSPS